MEKLNKIPNNELRLMLKRLNFQYDALRNQIRKELGDLKNIDTQYREIESELNKRNCRI